MKSASTNLSQATMPEQARLKFEEHGREYVEAIELADLLGDRSDQSLQDKIDTLRRKMHRDLFPLKTRRARLMRKYSGKTL